MQQSSRRVEERKPTAFDVYYAGTVTTVREQRRTVAYGTVDRMALAMTQASVCKRAGVLGQCTAILSSRRSTVAWWPAARVRGKSTTRWAWQLVAGTQLKQFDQPGQPGALSGDHEQDPYLQPSTGGSTEHVTEAESYDHGIP
jgi:hypothetical protein